MKQETTTDNSKDSTDSRFTFTEGDILQPNELYRYMGLSRVVDIFYKNSYVHEEEGIYYELEQLDPNARSTKTSTFSRDVVVKNFELAPDHEQDQ